MSMQALTQDAIVISMLLLVFSLGTRSRSGNVGYLFKQPAPVLLVRSLLAMNVLMPLVVIVLVASFDLWPAVKIALVALAVSPVPPFLPGKGAKLVADDAYVYSLLVVTSLASIVLVPLTMSLIGARINLPTPVRAGEVLRIITMTVVIPLALGSIVLRFWPGLAARLGPAASIASGVLLIIAFVPVLIAQWPVINSLIGDGTLLAGVVFTALGLLVGHVLGGPKADNRTVLALATSSRHPAIAVAIANAAFPDEKLAPAAVLLVLIVNALAAAPYTAWRKRLHLIGRRHA
jgi:bile acid:Na+ symporter, BASS family